MGSFVVKSDKADIFGDSLALCEWIMFVSFTHNEFGKTVSKPWSYVNISRQETAVVTIKETKIWIISTLKDNAQLIINEHVVAR